MAKGRRLNTSRSERLLGRYGYDNGHEANIISDASELGEEDVWSMVDDAAERNGHVVNNSLGEWGSCADVESNGGFSIRSRRRIPRDGLHAGGLSLAFEDSPGGNNKTAASSRIVHQFRQHDGVVASPPRHVATSAPMNVPDWSKILRVNSVESLHDSDEGWDDDDSEMVPPHEYLSRVYARGRKTGGSSVFEGVGRTLKGRDMSRVRDAVWSQTGFDG